MQITLYVDRGTYSAAITVPKDQVLNGRTMNAIATTLLNCPFMFGADDLVTANFAGPDPSMAPEPDTLGDSTFDPEHRVIGTVTWSDSGGPMGSPAEEYLSERRYHRTKLNIARASINGQGHELVIHDDHHFELPDPDDPIDYWVQSSVTTQTAMESVVNYPLHNTQQVS